MNNQDYRFAFRLPPATRRFEINGIGLVGYGIVLASALCPLIFGIVQFFATGDPGWWVIVVFSTALLFLFGPYAYWARRYYFLAITHDHQIIMRSIVNILPRRARFELEQVRYIQSPNPAISPGLVFLDMDKRRLGVFNTGMIPKGDFDRFLKIIREHNPSLKFLDW